jgi:G3E family GTPase
MAVPVYIISGFLGAGKTTLVNHLLASAPDGVRIMVLVNEFGRISIDKKIIKADPLQVVDLSGGCICCGMVTELIASLRFALDELKADVILIETTGLAVPQEIARQALTPVFEGRVESGGIITVVDAGGVLVEREPIIEAQLKEANVVVLNKTDLISSEMLAEVRDRIKGMVPPECRLLETRFGRVAYPDILSRREISLPITFSETQRQGLDSTTGFANICLVRCAPVEAEPLIAFFQKHRHRIVRSKGFILTRTGGLEIQVSRGGVKVKEILDPAHETELVLIVKDEDKEWIEDEVKRILDGPDP